MHPNRFIRIDSVGNQGVMIKIYGEKYQLGAKKIEVNIVASRYFHLTIIPVSNPISSDK